MEIKLKKNFLTNAEVMTMVQMAIDAYREEGDITGYPYSPLTMDNTFFAILYSLCIEDYDLDNTDDFDKYYNMGAKDYLLNNVTNALEAYDTLLSIADKMDSVGSVLNNLLNKLPGEDKLSELMDKLPDEWKNIANEYKNIIGGDEE